MVAGFDDPEGADPFAHMDDAFDEAPRVKRSAFSRCAVFNETPGALSAPERDRRACERTACSAEACTQ